MRPLEQAPSIPAGLLPLGRHQLERSARRPEDGRRATILVRHLRPLLRGVGAAGPDDLLAA
jgi:hypothetical protein